MVLGHANMVSPSSIGGIFLLVSIARDLVVYKSVGLTQLKGCEFDSCILLSGNNLRQFVHTHVPLSPCSINWYRSYDGDALWLGR